MYDMMPSPLIGFGTFQQPQAGPIHERGHKPLVPQQMVDYRFNFITRHYNWHSDRFSRSNNFTKIANFSIQYIGIKKKKSTQCLILS